MSTITNLSDEQIREITDRFGFKQNALEEYVREKIACKYNEDN